MIDHGLEVWTPSERLTQLRGALGELDGARAALASLADDILIEASRASEVESSIQAEMRRRLYAVAASWRVSPPTPADARISREQVATQELWRQVAEDVEAWADAPDHLVPDLVPRRDA